MSWRTWVLVRELPGLFLLAAVALAGEAVYKRLATVPATGEVTRVYSWPGETWFDRGVTNYAPVFRYEWSDGTLTEASPGNAHPDWDFQLGSRHGRAQLVRGGGDRRHRRGVPGARVADYAAASSLAVRERMRAADPTGWRAPLGIAQLPAPDCPPTGVVVTVPVRVAGITGFTA